VCFVCVYESSYVYSYVCPKESCLDDKLDHWLHISTFGTLSQECCWKTGQEIQSCDFTGQTCTNTSAHVWSEVYTTNGLFNTVFKVFVFPFLNAVRNRTKIVS
jgi:hypothetical protein